MSLGYNRYQAHLKELADTKHTASLLEQEREFKYKSLIGSNSIGFSIKEVDNSLVVFSEIAIVKNHIFQQETKISNDDNDINDFIETFEFFSYCELPMVENNKILTLDLQFKPHEDIHVSMMITSLRRVIRRKNRNSNLIFLKVCCTSMIPRFTM